MALDEEILRKATEARDRLIALQHDIDQVRSDYNHAIRRLHAAGASMREIAEVLGLSHQRVHQIVDETSGVPRPRAIPRRRPRAPIFPRRGPFQRFTEHARDVVVLAQNEARQLRHDFLGTEHILLALLGVEDGVAAKALRTLGVELDSARAAVRDIVGEGKGSPPDRLPFTSRSKKTLELALREALALGHNYIGTEHLLLALLRQEKAVAAQVLRRLGVDDERVREEIDRTLAA
jgi:hypothetical protein